MTDFVRARSEEQKQARMAEIKAAADSLFNSVPYQEITLSTIAGKLSWTRANLYKYVTTKEEIYLEICSDKMHSYFDDLFAAFPEGKTWTPDEWAGSWLLTSLSANTVHVELNSTLFLERESR